MTHLDNIIVYVYCHRESYKFSIVMIFPHFVSSSQGKKQFLIHSFKTNNSISKLNQSLVHVEKCMAKRQKDDV